VFGHEHYAEDFEDLACAATPIHGPISGKMVGAVDLTRWRKDADALLIALAKTTADQITQALPAAGSAPEVEPLQEYLRACRHSSGIVLARNSDMVMMNDYARQVLDPGDQVVLLGQAAEALAARRSGAVAVELPRALGADLLPARARRWPLRRRCAREADRVRKPTDRRGPGALPHVPGWPGRLRAAVAARVPAGGCGLRRGRVARP